MCFVVGDVICGSSLLLLVGYCFPCFCLLLVVACWLLAVACCRSLLIVGAVVVRCWCRCVLLMVEMSVSFVVVVFFVLLLLVDMCCCC